MRFYTIICSKGGIYMEILFQNSYIKNREWAKDVFGYISFRRPAAIVVDVGFFLCIGLVFLFKCL